MPPRERDTETQGHLESVLLEPGTDEIRQKLLMKIHNEKKQSFPAADSALSSSLANLTQPMGEVPWASSSQSQPELGPSCEELGTKASVRDGPRLWILTMLVSLLGPGQMGRWVFQPLPLQPCPKTLEDPVEHGRSGALTGPASQGTHQVCPLPSCKDESELVTVLNGHILGLIQNLLEQMLMGPK